MYKINYKKYCDVNLKYLKDKFNLKKFISSLDTEIKLGSTKTLPLEGPDLSNRWKSTSSIFFLTYESESIEDKVLQAHFIIDIFQEVSKNKKLNKELFLLEKKGKLLPTISKNFKFISSVKSKIKNTLFYCLYSNINKTFYLFINTEAKISNCYIYEYMTILATSNEPNKVRTSTEFAFFKTKQKDKAITQMISLSKSIEKGNFFEDGFYNLKQADKINILEKKIPLIVPKLHFRKSKFNIESFFNTLSKKDIPKFLSNKPLIFFNYALAKAYGYNEEKYSTKITEWIDHPYSKFENPTKSFAHLSKELRFMPLIQIIDNNPDGAWVSKKEIGYLYSKENNLSFIIMSSSFHTDKNNELMEYGRYDEWLQPEVLLKFEKISKKNLSNLSTILINHLLKNKIINKHHCNLVNLNDKFKWNKELLIKIFKDCAKKKFEENKQFFALQEEVDYYIEPQPTYYKVWFFMQKEKIMISKNPLSGCVMKDAWNYKAAFNMYMEFGKSGIQSK